MAILFLSGKIKKGSDLFSNRRLSQCWKLIEKNWEKDGSWIHYTLGNNHILLESDLPDLQIKTLQKVDVIEEKGGKDGSRFKKIRDQQMQCLNGD